MIELETPEAEPARPACGVRAGMGTATGSEVFRACWERSEGPGTGFLRPAEVSNETLPTSAARSVDGPRLEALGLRLDRFLSPKLDDSSAVSILLMPKAHLSSMGLEPKEEEGEGSGWEPVMYTDSERGVWLPPRPLEGGTPTSFVGGEEALTELASSASMMDSTSSMAMRMFSGLRSEEKVSTRSERRVDINLCG